EDDAAAGDVLLPIDLPGAGVLHLLAHEAGGDPVRRGVILRGGVPIVPLAWRADRPWSRMRGLLGRARLADGARQALWLVPCGSVHTAGMGYPLDIVFLDRGGRVLDCCEGVRPWR